MEFNLLSIEIWDDWYLNIGEIETSWNWGTLFSIGRTYDGIWEWEFLYYNLIRKKFDEWRESRAT